MRRPLFLKLAVWALIVAASVTSNAQTKLPKINFRERTLANGLRVLSVVDKSSPTVAINVWYHVGSKDDPDQRSGFAHLFEHIMFKATRNMKDEMMDRLTEDVGGNNNAFTQDDVTVYFEVIPSNYLETLLWDQTKEPPRTGEKRFVEYGKNVPLSAVGLTYLVPDEKSPDAAALTLTDIILSRGRSSRLYQALVYQQQVAQSANANADLREDAG